MEETGATTAGRVPIELDAAVAAHRQMLLLLFTVVARDAAARRCLMEAMEQRMAFRDGHEDPGVEPDAAVAFEARVQQEVQRLLEDVRAVAGPD